MNKYSTSVSLLALAVAGSATEALARSDTALDEIVVTARRIEENIRSVPVSVVALTPQALEKANFDNLSDVTQLAPAVRFTGSNNSIYQAQNLPIDSYGLVNARLDWANIAGSKVTVALSVRNLMDSKFKASPAFPASGIYNYAEPRMYGVDVTDRF